MAQFSVKIMRLTGSLLGENQDGNLSKIERGSRRSHLDTYLKLCVVLGIDVFAEARP